MPGRHNPSLYSLMYGYVPYEVQQVVSGNISSLSSRVFFFQTSHTQESVSPWHDILLLSPNGYPTMVCTTPAGTLIMRRPAVNEAYNPLQPFQRRDMMDSSIPAEYPFPVYWNVGFLPQTRQISIDGDYLPVQVIDIAADKERRIGHVYSVKLLGSCIIEFANWSVVTIIGVAADDSMSAFMNEISDIPLALPGFVAGLRAWLRETISLADQETKLTFEGHAATQRLLFDYHDHWQKYVKAVVDNSAQLSGEDGSDDECANSANLDPEVKRTESMESLTQQEYEGSMPMIIKEQFQQLSKSNGNHTIGGHFRLLKKATNGIKKLFVPNERLHNDPEEPDDSNSLAVKVSLKPSMRRRSMSDVDLPGMVPAMPVDGTRTSENEVSFLKGVFGSPETHSETL